MGNMLMSIEGQLKSMTLPKRKVLWPIFETVVNAIQSIEESENKDCGEITIYAHREDANQMTLSGTPEISAFDWFSVKDNGNGFNDQNFNSFCTAYSTLKLRKGCKGIGRFLWLKLFMNVSVVSTFRKDGAWFQRAFQFNEIRAVHSKEDADFSLTPLSDGNYSTVVKLEYVKSEYKSYMTKSLEQIARSIMAHCLLYFLSPHCPHIVIKDSDDKEYDLNEMYKNTLSMSTERIPFAIKDKNFTLCNMKKINGNDEHELHLCANNREVKAVKLKNHIPNLQGKLEASSKDESFYYQGYVISEYLDTIVSPDRTNFNFADDENDLFDEVTEKEIVEQVIPKITLYLQEALNDVDQIKRRKIDKFVTEEKPQYRYLLSRRPSVYDSISPNAQNDTIELILHKEAQKWEIELMAESKKIEQKIKNSKSLPENFQEIVDEYCQQITDMSKSSLTEYVLRRKSILLLLKEGISRQDDDSFNKENYIHNLIYPMRLTANDTPYESHNLWLIDERLSYYAYIASDCELESRKERPDILFLDNPVAVSDQDTGEMYNSIVIIELKRPMRDDYKQNDNPCDQLIGYVEKIRDQQAKDRSGRIIHTHAETRYYLYAICDITPSLEKILTRKSFQKTPDGLGRYFYHSEYNAYIEVIPFNKLLNDANKRNRILFDKLISPDINQRLRKDLENTNNEQGI